MGESDNRMPDKQWSLPGCNYAGRNRHWGDCPGEFAKVDTKWSGCEYVAAEKIAMNQKLQLDLLKVRSKRQIGEGDGDTEGDIQ